MPANLTPIYKQAEEAFKKAATNEEKIAALEHMLAVIPKHKGTDKMQADLRKKLSKFKNQSEKSSGKSSGSDAKFHIKKEGAAQIALVGLPNSGKSSFVDLSTNASPEIAEFAFTTRAPLAGMLQFENVQFQLIDLPPLSDEYCEYWVFNNIRNSDIVILFLDMGATDTLGDFEKCKELLKEKKMILFGKNEPEETSLSLAYKKTIIFITKMDLDPDEVIFELFEKELGKDFDLYPVSFLDEKTIGTIPRRIFELMNIVRVYSKARGKKPDRSQPFIFKRGSTLLDFAKSVHKEFVDKMKFACIWGEGKYDGQRVNKDYVLEDEDCIELHV
ncbi:MAG: TGS domain-containing protein [Pseudomonadota bacterium]